MRRIRDRVFGPDGDDPHGWQEALDAANLPARYRRATIDGVQPSIRPWAAKMLDAPGEWLGDGRGFIFLGDFGIGKSSLAGLFALDAAARCEAVLWLAAREVPGVIFREGERNEALHDRLLVADLLILDDLGAEAYSMERAGGAALEGAIRTVYDRDRSIIVTTNFSPSRLRERYPEPMVSVLERVTTDKEIK